MKGGTLLITNIIILAVGILLLAVFRHPNFVNTIIILTGVLFVVPGAGNMISLSREQKKPVGDATRRSAGSRIASWITCGAALILGATMIIIPEAYSALFVYIFAMTLAFGGLYHLYMMMRGLRPARFAIWLYILPLALLGCAAAIFFVPSLTEPEGQSTVILLTGSSLVVFAAMSFIEMIVFRKAVRQLPEATPDTSHTISK